MKAFEKLLSLTKLSNCATAQNHFCSIGKGFENKTIYTHRNVFGVVKKISQLKGFFDGFYSLTGNIGNIKNINGYVGEIIILKGDLENLDNIKGNVRCQNNN